MTPDQKAELTAALMEVVRPFAGRLNSPEVRESIVQALRDGGRAGTEPRYTVGDDGRSKVDERGDLSWEDAARRAVAEILGTSEPVRPKVVCVSSSEDDEAGVMRFSITGLDPELLARLKADT